MKIGTIEIHSLFQRKKFQMWNNIFQWHPCHYYSTGFIKFDINEEFVFSLENVHGDKIYSNDPEIIEKLKKEKELTINNILVLQKSLKEEGFNNKQIERMVRKWSDGDYYEIIPEGAEN